jgi:hypothetical protein
MGRISVQRKNDSPTETVENKSVRPTSTSAVLSDTDGNLGGKLDELIKAQNRTTYAVRSLAVYFFIYLQTALVGGGVISFAINDRSHYDEYGNLNSGATFFLTLGCLIVIIGFVCAVILGRDQLDKSKLN